MFIIIIVIVIIIIIIFIFIIIIIDWNWWRIFGCKLCSLIIIRERIRVHSCYVSLHVTVYLHVTEDLRVTVDMRITLYVNGKSFTVTRYNV